VSQVRVKVSPLWLRHPGKSWHADTIRGSMTLHRNFDGDSTGKVFCASFEAPIGIIYVASTEKGLCKIALPKDGKSSFLNWIGANFQPEEIVDDRRKNSPTIRQLNEYLIGKRTKFEIDIDLIGTPFQQRIWTELMKIPYGTITTYKQLAKLVHTKGYRAVGASVSRNPLPIVIPCHRVIGSDLKLVNYSGGIRLKEYLLRLEGIILV